MIYLYAFLIGGALCAAAQIIIDLTAVTPARVLVGYVCVGVLLTGLGLYDPLVRLAGCGATTPLTGFGYCLAEGVRRAVDERGLIGAFTGGLSGCAGGIAAALLSGLAAAAVYRESVRCGGGDLFARRRRDFLRFLCRQSRAEVVK